MNVVERAALRTAIYRAIRRDDATTLSTLDVVGPFVGYDGPFSIPLVYALTYGALECAKWLLSNGADVEQCWGDLTPLMRAAYAADERFLKLLLDAGARIDAIDKYGNTTLNHVCGGFNMSPAHFLIDHGARMCTYDHGYEEGKKRHDSLVAYYNARLQRRARQRAFMAAVLSAGPNNNNNKDLVRLFAAAMIKK